MLKRLDPQGFSILERIRLKIILEIQMFILVQLMRVLISELILRSVALAILMCRLMPQSTIMHGIILLAIKSERECLNFEHHKNHGLSMQSWAALAAWKQAI